MNFSHKSQGYIFTGGMELIITLTWILKQSMKRNYEKGIVIRRLVIIAYVFLKMRGLLLSQISSLSKFVILLSVNLLIIIKFDIV